MAFRVRTVTRPRRVRAPPCRRSATTSAGSRPRTTPSASRDSCRSSGCTRSFDDGQIVGGAGAFPFELTVPGGALPCAGVTVVGVLPTHRRRGLLRRMMGAQLDDVRERGEPIAALWASEETIYGRFGYGLASLVDAASTPSERAVGDPARAAARGLRAPGRRTTRRSRVFPRAVRARRADAAGDDRPLARLVGGPAARRRARAAPRRRAARARAPRARRRPVGYALYRLVAGGLDARTPGRRRSASSRRSASTTRRPRDIWRFLLEIDWVDRIAAYHLPVDHPLPLLVDRLNKLRLSVWDGLWVRVVDVPAALAGRAYALAGAGHRRGRLRPALPRQRRDVDDRGRRGAPRAAAGPTSALAVDALGSGVPRRVLLRAARARRARRGGRPRGARPRGRGVPRRRRAVVRGELLTPEADDRRHRSERSASAGSSPGSSRGAASRSARSRGTSSALPDLGGAEIALARLRRARHAARRARAGRPRVHGLDARAAGPADRAPPGFVDVAVAAAASPGSSTSRSSAPVRRRRSSTPAPTARRRRCWPRPGIPFTAVRNGMYADEIASWFDADGRITGPGGDGRLSLTLPSGARRGDRRAARRSVARRPAGRHDHGAGDASRSRSSPRIASEVTGDAYRYEPLGRDDVGRVPRGRSAGPSGRSRPGSPTTTACGAARRTSSRTTIAS